MPLAAKATKKARFEQTGTELARRSLEQRGTCSLGQVLILNRHQHGLLAGIIATASGAIAAAHLALHMN